MPQSENTQILPLPEEEKPMYFLGHPPSWLVNWGMTLVLISAAIFLILAWLIRYPDIITAKVKIMTEEPAIRVNAPNGGKIATIYVQDEQAVSLGEKLILLDNTATLEDVYILENILTDSMQKNFYSLSLPDDLVLGVLQSSYTQLRQKTKSYQYFRKRTDINKKVSALQRQIKHTEKLNIQSERDRKTLRREYDIYVQNYERYTKLHQAGSVSNIDLETQEKASLQAQRQLENLDNQVLNNKIRIEQIRTQIIDLQQGKSKEQEESIISLQESHAQLLADLRIWKKGYLLTAPISGKISLNTNYREKQFVKSGEEILTVVPLTTKNEIAAEGFLPATNIGKIKLGMPVNLQVSGYPYQEFGLVKAEVASIAAVPQADNYLIKFKLLDGLHTTYGKTLQFKQEIQTTAEIITEDRRILDRIFDKIRSILKKYLTITINYPIMKIFETLRDIETLDQLIRLKATGNRQRLASRMDKSERTIHNLIELMKEMGAPVFYCKQRRSYCYEKEVKFSFGFVMKSGENEKISGGNNVFFGGGNFFALTGRSFGVSTLIGEC